MPALRQIYAYSLAADQLVMGTLAQESHGTYIKLLGKDPAMGVQMEPLTHKDIWLNFIKYKRSLSAALLSMTSDSVDENYYVSGCPDLNALVWNNRYAAMCELITYPELSKAMLGFIPTLLAEGRQTIKGALLRNMCIAPTV